MHEQLMWAAGFAVTLITLIGGIIARDRAMNATIAQVKIDATADIATAKASVIAMMKLEDDRLHERLNRVRDEYVRRQDLDGHIERLETNIKEARAEQSLQHRDVTQRLDAVLTALSTSSKRA